jgi:hypothetical protein
MRFYWLRQSTAGCDGFSHIDRESKIDGVRLDG